MSRKRYLEKVAALQGVRPILRPVMCGPFWWVLLLIQALVAPPLAIIANINIPAMWRDYIGSLRDITSTRRAIVRASKETR